MIWLILVLWRTIGLDSEAIQRETDAKNRFGDYAKQTLNLLCMTRETDAKLKTDAKLLYKEESYIIQGGAFEVYKQFRNRHKEVIYQRALVEYFKNKKLNVEREKQIPIYFQDKKVGVYIPDVVVNNSVFVELKCKPNITKDDINQFWYYLKCSDYKVGYLINFGSAKGVQIMRRIYDTAREK